MNNLLDGGSFAVRNNKQKRGLDDQHHEEQNGHFFIIAKHEWLIVLLVYSHHCFICANIAPMHLHLLSGIEGIICDRP